MAGLTLSDPIGIVLVVFKRRISELHLQNVGSSRSGEILLMTVLRLLFTAVMVAGAGPVLADTHYVDASKYTDVSPNPNHPFTSWATAAGTIQEAVDAAESPPQLSR